VPSSLAASVRPDPAQRLSRAAVFAFGATLAGAGCSDTTPAVDSSPGDTGVRDQGTEAQADTGSPVDTGTIGPDYGLPPDSGRVDAAVDDTGTAMPEYGVAPDAGPPDTGSTSTDYGVPPDAGPVDTGAILPPYGVPPADAY
jgi:hypothetical protein